MSQAPVISGTSFDRHHLANTLLAIVQGAEWEVSVGYSDQNYKTMDEFFRTPLTALEFAAAGHMIRLKPSVSPSMSSIKLQSQEGTATP